MIYRNDSTALCRVYNYAILLHVHVRPYFPQREKDMMMMMMTSKCITLMLVYYGETLKPKIQMLILSSINTIIHVQTLSHVREKRESESKA